MAQSTKHAFLICLALTIIAAAGGAAAVYWKKPLAVIICALPAAAYEVYRTEGLMTKLAALGIFAVFIAEILFIAFGFKLDVGKYIARYISFLPTVDAKLLGPVVIAILAIMLVRRTAGIYTIWLAVVLFVSAAALLYSLDPALFKSMVQPAVKEGIRRVPQRI